MNREILEKLSVEDKRELARLLEIKYKRKSENRIDSYVARKGVQEEFHKSGAKIRLFSGSNQSGKTTSLCLEAIWHALGTHPYRKIKIPNTGRLIHKQSFETGIQQTLLPKLYEWLPKGSVKKTKKNSSGIVTYIEFNNGSIIHLMSGEMDKEAFESVTIDWVGFDEPVKREIYVANLRGIIKNSGSAWLTLTGLSEPWIYDELYLPGQNEEILEVDGVKYPEITIKSFTVDIWDNAVSRGGYLPDEQIAFFINSLLPEERESRVYGRFNALVGRVFKEFVAERHVVDEFKWPREWPVYLGIDPHTKKEHHAVWVGITKEDDLIVIDELKESCTLPELARLVLNINYRNQYNIVGKYIDPSINTTDGIYRTNMKRVLEEAGLTGLRFPCKKDNIDPGINEIRRLLIGKRNEIGDGIVKPSLYFFKRCKGIIHEMMRYQWDVNGERPKKMFDDFIDPFRYIVISQPNFTRHLNSVSYFGNANKRLSAYGY